MKSDINNQNIITNTNAIIAIEITNDIIPLIIF